MEVLPSKLVEPESLQLLEGERWTGEVVGKNLILDLDRQHVYSTYMYLDSVHVDKL